MQSAFFLGLLRAGSLWPFPTFPWLNNSLIWFLISQSKACNEQCLAMFLDTGCIHFSINAACQAASLEDSLHQAKQLHKRSTNMYQWRHKKPFFGGSDATVCLHVKIWLWTYLRTIPDWPTLRIVMPYRTTVPPYYIWTYYTSKVWYDWYKLQVWHNTRQNDLYRDKEMR